MSASRTPWRWTAHDADPPHLHVLYEAYLVSMRRHATSKGRHEIGSRAWTEIIENSLPEPLRTKALATLCSAVFHGLNTEHLSTGDPEGTERLVDLFNEMLAARAGVTLPPCCVRSPPASTNLPDAPCAPPCTG